MQSRHPYAFARSHFSLREARFIRQGARPIGQYSTHLPQRMQIDSCASLTWLSDKTMIPLVLFITGVSRLYWAIPIIGPPKSIFLGSFFKGPHFAIKSFTGVPMRTKKFPGFSRQ